MNRSKVLYNNVQEVGFEALFLPRHLDDLPSVMKDA